MTVTALARRCVRALFLLVISGTMLTATAARAQDTNQAPTAVITDPIRPADGGVTVTLDGSGSTDPDGDDAALTYAWSRLSGTGITLTGAATDTVSFTTPAQIVTPQVFSIQLIVTDPGGLSSAATATITVPALGAGRVPVANAGPDQTVAVGEELILDGSGSTHPDDDVLTYGWRQTSGTSWRSDGRDFTHAGATLTVTPHNPALVAGNMLVFTLTVTDPDGETHTDSAVITIAPTTNQAPEAVITDPIRTVDGGVTVTLDGSGSTDPDGDTLSYAWSLLPGTTGITLTGADTGTVSFITPAQIVTQQLFSIQLIVTDPGGLSSRPFTAFATITVPALGVNRAPVANAGPDQTVDPGETFTLDGTGSSDPDGDDLTYTWTQISGNDVLDVGPFGPFEADVPTLVVMPTNASLAGGNVLVFRLAVTDSNDRTSSDTVSITMASPEVDPGPDPDPDTDDTSPPPPGNRAPTVSRAIADYTLLLIDGPDTLDVARSFRDRDGDTLAYSASSDNTAVATVTVSGSSVTVTPVAAGTTTLTVTATDPSGLSVSQTVELTVDSNRRPTIVSPIAALSLTVPGAPEALGVAASFSDPDGDTLTYSAASGDETVAAVTVEGSSVTVTPLAEGRATLTVTATDPGGLSVSQMVEVTVIENRAPTANAGLDQSVDEAELVTLDGSESSDPDGDDLTYTWTQLAGTDVTLSGADTASPSFTAPIRQTPDDATLVFQLAVSDGQAGDPVTDEVTISVTADATIQKTVETLNEFLSHRTNLILANQPKAARRINRLKRGVGTEQLAHTPGDLSGGAPVDFDLNSIGSNSYNVATSLDQVTRAAENLRLQVGDADTAEHTRRRFDVWFEGSLHKFSGAGDSGGTFAVVHLGADYLVSPDLLVGAQVQYDSLSDSSTDLTYRVEGKGWMVGPYVTARLQKNLYLDGRMAWGKSDNEISPHQTYTDNFTSERRLVNLGLSGDFSKGKWTLQPNLSLSYIDERQKAYVNALNVTIPGQKVSRSQMQLGPNLSTRFVGPSGLVFVPSFTIDAIYSHASTSGAPLINEPTPDNGWRARSELGLSMTTLKGIRASITGNYDGIGQGGFEAYGIGLTIGLTF